MITRLLLVCALALSAVPASADDSAQANRLLVEAAKSFRQAYRAGTTQRLDLLQSTLNKLNEIVEAHPSSNLAVQIITGQQIGMLSLGSLARSVGVEHMKAGNYQDALAAANQIAHIENRDELLHEIALAQARDGEFQDAFATANMVPDNRQSRRTLLYDASPRDTLLANIAEILVTEAGNRQAAQEAVSRIKPGEYQNETRRRLRLYSQ